MLQVQRNERSSKAIGDIGGLSAWQNDLAVLGKLALLWINHGPMTATQPRSRLMDGRSAMLRLEANGTTIAYTRSGRGPPIVLMHGAEADHSMFAALTAQLEKHLTVIAYDQRDSGETSNPSQPYTLEDMGEDAAALIQGLGFERAHVYGTSLGSLIAQSLAVRHPKRLDRLVLAAPIRIGRTLAEIVPETAAQLRQLRADREKNAEEIARIFYPEPHLAAHPELLEPFKLQRRTPEQLQRRTALLGPSPMLDLSRITAPTLVLAGRDDRLVPYAHSVSIAKEIRLAQTLILEGVGHVNAIQAPERVAQAIFQFLGVAPR
jgi:3-oxoadipate enol-lactonase